MYQEILATDRRSEGVAKLHAMFVELYTLTTVSITGATSLTSAAFGKIHNCSGTTSSYTVDLPTAVGNAGQSIILKGTPTLTRVVTVQGISGELIDGEINRQISAQGMISLMSDGADWVVIDEVGSWIYYTPVLGGWSSDPTIDRSEYFRVGKMVTVKINMPSNGTSNTTIKTITVPFVAGGPVQFGLFDLGANNGAGLTTPGQARTRDGSNIVDLHPNLNAGTWSAGDTGCRMCFTLNYIMA